jgi:hypothetical protein
MGSLLCRSFRLAHMHVLPSAGQTVQGQAESVPATVTRPLLADRRGAVFCASQRGR